MIFYDLSFDSPIENLMCDDLLLKRAARGAGPARVLRLWESPRVFVVLGIAGRVADDVYRARCRSDCVDILRRSSGGGTVLQGPGCLNFSLIYSRAENPLLQDLHRSYTAILAPVIRALGRLGVEAELCPVSDLALTATRQKISGNAQRRLKGHILHHGTILYRFSCELIERYLRFPKSVPDYRSGRSHRDFVVNIPIDVFSLRRALVEEFQPVTKVTRLNPDEQEEFQTLIAETSFRYRV